jgi:aspartyl protease family protein
LSRQKRELRPLREDWQRVADQIGKIRRELQRLNQHYGELNLQLARVAGVDTAANNRIVGLLNATSVRMKSLAEQRELLKEELSKRRAILNEAESAYAENVLAIRDDFVKARQQLVDALAEQDVQIALQVMSANFETPAHVSADQILLALDKRIERIEQEVFRETIPLVVEQNSMYVDVVVGKKSTRMVVDSGATLICLPQRVAAELEVVVPSDARDMVLVLADGSELAAKGVTLPRVRVGEFEAENVEAAVLDASAAEAEPLLGMSFLGNFRFELDPAEQTLKLLRVGSE